jgi:hypothetical protein
MSTTKHYLHLAGVVFHDEASALESRMLGVSRDERDDESEVGTRIGTHLREPKTTYQNGSGSTKRVGAPSDTPSGNQLF